MAPDRFSSMTLVAAAGLFAATNAWYLSRMRGAGKEFSLHARRLYNFDTLLFPALLAGAAPVLRPRQRKAALGIAGACLASRIYATHIEPRILKVRRVRLPLRKISRPVRILHISDMETDAVRNQEPKVIQKARELRPDLIFHTGDLLAPVEPATYQSELPRMSAVWQEVEPPLGKLAVIGEVDRPILHQLDQGVGGLRALNGETTRLDGPGFRLNVLGLTFDQSCNKDPDEVREVVSRWLETVSPADVMILVGHRPDYILSVEDLPIDLCLAGHTHGGQVRVPFFGPLRTQSEVPDKWSSGYHRTGKTRLNVSAGVGFEHGNGFPAVRVNCPPEMTLIELVPEGEGP